jgi:hypothetical protein
VFISTEFSASVIGMLASLMKLHVVHKGKEVDGLLIVVFRGLLVLRNPSWNGKWSSLKMTCLDMKILP